MKTLKDIKKNVGTLEMPLTGKELIMVALENFPGLTGIKNMLRMIRLYEKVENADAEFTVEDAEFEILYQAIYSMPWRGKALKAKEFFIEIAALKEEK